MANLGSTDTPAAAQSLDLPNGYAPAIEENSGDLVVNDSNGNTVLRWDDTNGKFQLAATLDADGNDLTNIGAVGTDKATINREFNPAQTESIHFLDCPAPAKEYWSPSSSGSGFAVSSKAGALLFGTGGTQGSRGEMWFNSGGDNDASPPSEIADWSKDRIWRCYVSVTDVDELIRFGMGLLRDGERWIGFAFDSGSVYAVSNDGNTKNRTEINATPATGAYDLEMRFVSGSRVEYYIDGAKQTEHTANLPSGNLRASFLIAGRAENPNSGTDARAGYERTEVVVKA